MKKRIIAIAGPTASGKTSLAVKVARLVGGEVVSNDSMQIYKGMAIGTAAPTVEEMEGVVHHLIGFADPESEFSCADYAPLAREKIDEICDRGKIPVFCGGTGLYLDSVLSVGDMSESEKNEELRASLLDFAEREGAEALHERLRAVDPEAALAIHKNNVRRVVRALEIFETTGVTKTEWDARSKERELPYDVKMGIIEFADRELLYSRIEKRVDMMVEAGLLSEALPLYEKGILATNKQSAQAIGYKELIPYFEGKCTLDEALDAIKLGTRHYAKRQITWFRKYKDAYRLVPDEGEKLKSAEELALEFVSRIGFKDGSWE